MSKAKSKKARTVYRDRRGVFHDAETHKVVARDEVRRSKLREVPAPRRKAPVERPPVAEPVDAVPQAPEPSTAPVDVDAPEPSTAPPAALDDSPPIPTSSPVVASAPESTAPVPPPSTAPVTAPPAANQAPPPAAPAPTTTAPVAAPPPVPSTAPTARVPVVTSAPEGSHMDAAGEAARIEAAARIAPAADCPHCEVDVHVCPKCNRTYPVISRETARLCGVVVGSIAGAIGRAVAGRKSGVRIVGRPELSSSDGDQLEAAFHGFMRRRLPASAGKVDDILAVGIVLTSIGAHHYAEAMAQAQAMRATLSAPPANTAPPAAAPPAAAPAPTPAAWFGERAA